MAQPTTALLCPEPDDNPLDLLCPPFCDGTCEDGGDEPGNLYHTSGFTTVDIFGLPEPSTLDVSVARSDDDGKPGDNVINLLAIHDNFGTCLTAEQARRLAALLLNAADDADPLPYGVLSIPAAHVRIRDEISTLDGWQTVVGQLAFDDQVSVWTDDEAHHPDTSGWEFQPDDLVQVRRRIHGSTAIAFVEQTR